MIQTYYKLYKNHRNKNIITMTTMIISLLIMALFSLYMNNHNTYILFISISLIIISIIYMTIMVIRSYKDFFTIDEMKYYILASNTDIEKERAKKASKLFIGRCVLDHEKRKRAYNEIINNNFNILN